jgi:hypothetical protein
MGCGEVLDERNGKCRREEVFFFVLPVLSSDLYSVESYFLVWLT